MMGHITTPFNITRMKDGSVKCRKFNRLMSFTLLCAWCLWRMFETKTTDVDRSSNLNDMTIKTTIGFIYMIDREWVRKRTRATFQIYVRKSTVQRHKLFTRIGFHDIILSMDMKWIGYWLDKSSATSQICIVYSSFAPQAFSYFS